MRVAKPIELNADDDRRLRILSKRRRIEARLQLRARIVLLAAGGTSDKDIAQSSILIVAWRPVGARGIWASALMVSCRMLSALGGRVRHEPPSTCRKLFA